MNDQEPTVAPVTGELPVEVPTAPLDTPAQAEAPVVAQQPLPTQTVVAEQPPMPTQPQQTILTPASQQFTESIPPITSTPKKGRAKWFLPAIIVGVILVISAGAYGYMGVYLQSPENLWKSALNNTGDALTGYVTAPQKTYSGGKITGSFAMTSPTVADGSLTGAYDDKNATLTVNAGAFGVRATAEVRSITTEPATSPDVYVNVSGLKSLAALMGASSPYSTLIQQVDGHWYFIDHTLTAKATSQVSATPESAEQLQKDVQDVATRVNTVLQDYLFTTDQSKAVVVIKEPLNKEDFKGRQSQKYIAQVRKQQLKDMVTALKDTLKDSKANDWVVGSSGKTFEEQVDFDQLLKDIDALPEDKLTAEVWVDTGLKYIRNVRITVPGEKEGSTNTADFMLDYTGGDSVPIIITSTTKDATGEGSVQVGVTLHKNSSNVELNAVVTGKFNGQKAEATLKIAVEPTNDALVITKPDGAKNIMELLGGVLGANTTDGVPSSNPALNFLNGLQ